ncbi:MAG TPA: glycosyltransferase family 2 protein [Vicinamibacteria bacterium]|nr:glycosyltransferase family 2 protein [Vicinamibacteria bacterium]
MPATLSVVLITRNAAHLLPDTLGAVSWADEILVVDSGSTDGTREVAQALGAKVILQSDWKGYGHQKSFAVQQASGDWVLVLDADEVVDAELGQEIQRALESKDGIPAGYRMKRVNYFCGERVRFGHSRPSYVDRLFRRGKGRVTNHLVHERILVEGPVARLRGEIRHYTSESISHRIRKNDDYATIVAEEWFREGKRVGLLHLLLIVPLSVLRDLVLKAGILEGKKGVILAFLGALYSFSKYAKLIELAKREREQ